MVKERKFFGKINYFLSSVSMIIFCILIIDIIYFYSVRRPYELSRIFSAPEILNFYILYFGYNITLLTVLFSFITIYFQLHRAIKIKKNSFIRNASLFGILYNPFTLFLLMHPKTNSLLRISSLIILALFTILWIKDFIVEEEYWRREKRKTTSTPK